MDANFITNLVKQNTSRVLDATAAAQTDALLQTRNTQVTIGSFLQHEVRRLEKKLGTSHPRVQQLQASLNRNLQTVNCLDVELEIDSIQESQVDPNSNKTVIHGRVVDQSNRGISGVNVSLRNPSGTVIRSVKTVETDSSGYYALEIDEKSFNELENLAQEGLFIAVSTRKGKQLYQQPQPLQLKQRDRTLVEVVLNRNDISPIGDIKRPT